MMETSLSIHPEHFVRESTSAALTPGNILSFAHRNDGVTFQCERGQLHICVYEQDIIRVVYDPVSQPLNYRSHAVILEAGLQSFEIELLDSQFCIHTSLLTIQVLFEPASVQISDRATGQVRLAEPQEGMYSTEDGGVGCHKCSHSDERIYGFGEKAGFLNKKGERLSMWNTDVYAPHNQETDALYVSIPYYLAVHKQEAYGILFDNTFQSTFDMREQAFTTFQADGGTLNYYFLAGPDAKSVIKQLARLTGKAPLPPKWSLGYHQSRYSYETDKEVRELADTFRRKGIPLDAIYLDIHYMEGYRVFTVDENRFPDLSSLSSSLLEDGIRLVTIVDPGVKLDSDYEVYQEGIAEHFFCKDQEGNVFQGSVWPGESVFPDFTNEKVRKWWGQQQTKLTNVGISGIWNDMNEPSVFNESKTMDLEVMHENDGEPSTHKELHNIYGLVMTKATYEGLLQSLNGRRPFVVTRAGYAGIQRYGAVWTGDNRSFWEHLQMLIPMCLNLGLSGVPISGADIGGFAHDAKGDLLVRWTQAAVFTPYFRNHSEMKSTRQEPWVFGTEVESLVNEAIKMRYRWMPQLYKLVKESTVSGIPIMRPMFLEFPDDPDVWNISDQFLFGDNIVVAPILRPDSPYRTVYLPKGQWIDYWTEERIDGGKPIIAHAPLNIIPLYIKANSARLEENVRYSSAEPAEELTVHLYLGERSFQYSIFEDDGETFNQKEEIQFYAEGKVQFEDGKLVVAETLQISTWTPSWKRRSFVIHTDEPLTSMSWNGKQFPLLEEARGERKVYVMSNSLE